MISYFYQSVQDQLLRTNMSVRPGVWIHAVAPTTHEMDELIDRFKLDSAVVSDIRDYFEFPRFEMVTGTAYFFTRYPYDSVKQGIDTAPLLIIVGDTFIMTIAEQEVPFLHGFIEGVVQLRTTQKTKLFLQFLRALTESFEKQLSRMRKPVYRDIGRLRTIRKRDIERLVYYEQELNEIIAAVLPTNQWIEQLSKGDYIPLFPDDRSLVEDLRIANSQLVESAKSLLKTIQNIRMATDAMLTQNLNNTIRMLTAFTIVLTIPTLISSLYGMNVPLPYQEDPRAFPIILLCIGSLIGGIIYFFKRMRWM